MLLLKKCQKMRIKYKPMTWAYVAIIALCVIIRCVPISCGYASLDDSINDFAVGALASTWVAWLIDIATCRSKNKELKDKERIAFATYVDYVFSLVDSLSRIGAMLTYTTKEKSVKEWLDIISDLKKYKCDDPILERQQNYRRIVRMIDSIKTSLQMLQHQHVMLVEANIVDTYDFHQHAEFQIGLCDTIIGCLEDNEFSETAIGEANVLIDMLVDGCRTFIPDVIPMRHTWLDAKG